jgi:hypothetical protein
VIPVVYEGQLVAAATAERAFPGAALLQLDDYDPVLRFVMAMCLYAMDVEAGVFPGPYREDAAAAFARARLMPRELFACWMAQADERIAHRFGRHTPAHTHRGDHAAVQHRKCKEGR